MNEFEKLQGKYDRLLLKQKELKEKTERLTSYLRTFSTEASYTGYLQREMMRLEALNAEQQHIIEQYQAHYSKYGHFYTDYQQSHSMEEPTQV